MDTVLGVLSCGLYIYYINYTQDVSHIKERSLKPRTSGGEWVSSILFAVVAATIVHTYVMQPFTIPTSSLEKTLLVGDFLFVSKFHYGARTPMTAVSFPMVHDTIPVLKSKSYLKDIQIPYFRFPGFQKIKQNDIVVFSWPPDTLTNITDRFSKVDIKPMDKKSNYVKRCVGLPGDSLEVRDGYVYINGIQNKLPERAKLQFAYRFTTTKKLNPSFVGERYDITDLYPADRPASYRYFTGMMTDAAYEKFKNYPDIDTIFKIRGEKGVLDPSTFPHNPNYNWNSDYFGAMYIPKAGASVSITAETLPLYRRIIEVYEGSEIGINNKISQSGTQVLLNGTPLTSYTFKYDYYWLMGDNRNNSQDARMWGFVPFTHVVGKPVLVWMSWNSNAKGIMNKVRWERLFTTVGGDGKPVSYFKYFLILVVGWFIFDFFRKKKKTAKK
jgi:signal peptidase I